MIGRYEGFTELTMFEAENARVGLAVCRRCGAAVLLDPREEVDVFKLHDAWHAVQESEKAHASS